MSDLNNRDPYSLGYFDGQGFARAEIARLEGELAKQQAVVDAVRKLCQSGRHTRTVGGGIFIDVGLILRTLDGEP